MALRRHRGRENRSIVVVRDSPTRQLAQRIHSTHTRRRRQRRFQLAALAASVIAVGSLAAWLLTSNTGNTNEPLSVAAQTPGTSMPAEEALAADVPECPEPRGAVAYSGSSRGDDRSGIGAIRTFNYAYYSLRSAAAARAVTSQDAVAPQEVLQSYIDRVPVGTTYCLSVIPRTPDSFRVVLTERPPDLNQPATVYRQLVQTTTTAGRVWITSITPDGG